MLLRHLVPLVLCGFCAGAGLWQHEVSAQAAEADRQALSALALPEAGRLGFEHPERRNWSFFPGQRAGAWLGDLTPEARADLERILQTILGPVGWRRVLDVWTLEGVLRELEDNPGRDPDHYAVAVFGDPSQADQPLGLRLEGHHLSLNLTWAGGRWASTTPFFLGANPGRVAAGPHAGLEPLGSLEAQGFALLRSMNPKQREQALIAERPPADILMGSGVNAAPRMQGLDWSAMAPGQQQALRALVQDFARTFRDDLAHELVRTVAGADGAGWEAVHFAWAGADRPGVGHYFRVQGATFVIEYDNVQQGANHPHAVWRGLDDDFGLQSLAEHRAQESAQDAGR